MEAGITVDGKIVSELSEKIPSNIIALNELIKNSYDAGSENVYITISSKEKKMIIEDYGCGMGLEDITKLFHISNSEKIYGKLNEFGRYTQGSKGLGFLSVFKFGTYVVWKTYKEEPYRFSADYNEITSLPNLSEFKVPILPDDTMNHKGTIIEITLDEYNKDSLINYFMNDSNRDKIICSFNDDFHITLNLDGNIYEYDKTPSILDICKDRQLFYITYSSDDKKIVYSYNNHIVREIDYEFTSTRYHLDLRLMSFQLTSGAKQSFPNRLFFDPNNELTPLIYMNKNLFSNYSLFNPSIMRSSKSSNTLAQMIGYVDIISSDPEIGFNSDRTQLLQNALTDEITLFLQKINKDIQKYGSEMKKYLVKLDYIDEMFFIHADSNTSIKELQSYIKDDFYFKNQVQVEKEGAGVAVVYSIFGKEKRYTLHKPTTNSTSTSQKSSERGTDSNASKPKPMPFIELTKSKDTLKVNDNTIDLLKYVKVVRNCEGKEVDSNDLEIYMDENEIGSTMGSVTVPCIKRIIFKLKNSEIPCSKQLELEFVDEFSPVNAIPSKQSLFTIPGPENYTITYSIIIGNLLNQLKRLEPQIDDYIELFTCACRVFFDASCAEVKRKGKVSKLLRISALEEQMRTVIEYALEGPHLTEISKSLNMSYKTIKNVIEKIDVSNIVRIIHLGAHSSNNYVSLKELEDAIQKAMQFIVICNEIINNDKIK